MISSSKALELLSNVGLDIKKIISITKQSDYSEIDENIGYNEDDPEERLLENEIYRLLENLDVIKDRIDYLNLPILVIGKLTKNKQGRFVLATHEFHCGDRIEFLYYNEINEKNEWSISTIEHDGNDYYAVGYQKVCLLGVTARLRNFG